MKVINFTLNYLSRLNSLALSGPFFGPLLERARGFRSRERDWLPEKTNWDQSIAENDADKITCANLIVALSSSRLKSENDAQVWENDRRRLVERAG